MREERVSELDFGVHMVPKPKPLGQSILPTRKLLVMDACAHKVG